MLPLPDAINDGEILGPRMLVSGPALGITGGHCDENLLAPQYNHRATGGMLSKGDQPGTQQYTLEEMQAIVDEAHKLGRKVAAHAHGTEGIKAAIRAGVDSIEHASLIDDEGIRLAKERGTFLVMDIYNDDFILSKGLEMGMLPESIEEERKIGQLQRDNFARAHRGGARHAFGTDSAVYPHGDNARQFAHMVNTA